MHSMHNNTQRKKILESYNYGMSTIFSTITYIIPLIHSTKRQNIYATDLLILQEN